MTWVVIPKLTPVDKVMNVQLFSEKLEKLVESGRLEGEAKDIVEQFLDAGAKRTRRKMATLNEIAAWWGLELLNAERNSIAASGWNLTLGARV